jgi:Ribbon-helix-helix protein, copG family
MVKTTIYLPESLKAALARAAAATGRSEADLIREGVSLVVERESPPSPRVPLYESGDPTLAGRVDELLAGFGGR